MSCEFLFSFQTQVTTHQSLRLSVWRVESLPSRVNDKEDHVTVPNLFSSQWSDLLTRQSSRKPKHCPERQVKNLCLRANLYLYTTFPFALCCAGFMLHVWCITKCVSVPKWADFDLTMPCAEWSECVYVWDKELSLLCIWQGSGGQRVKAGGGERPAGSLFLHIRCSCCCCYWAQPYMALGFPERRERGKMLHSFWQCI